MSDFVREYGTCIWQCVKVEAPRYAFDGRRDQLINLDLSAIEALGAYGSALLAIGYGFARTAANVVDRVAFLIGLRMILRRTAGQSRVTILVAYVERGQVYEARRRGCHRTVRARAAGQPRRADG